MFYLSIALILFALIFLVILAEILMSSYSFVYCVIEPTSHLMFVCSFRLYSDILTIKYTAPSMYSTYLLELVRHSSTSSSNKSNRTQVYVDMKEKDLGQCTNNLFILAKRHIESGDSTTYLVLNKFLLGYGLSVTEEQLIQLVNIKPVELQLSTNKLSYYALLKQIVGNMTLPSRGDVTTPGVYIFTNTKTGDQYVGSSITLGNRLPLYFTKGTIGKDKRAIIKSFKEFGLASFKLSIYKIDITLFNGSFKVLSLVRALEQYYIFTLNPTLNTSKVAGGKITGPLSEDKLKPLYIYNSDKTKLLLITTISSLLKNTPIKLSTIGDSLRKDGLGLGNLFYSRTKISDAKEEFIDTSMLSHILTEGLANRYINRSANVGLSSNTQKIGVKITDLLSPDKSTLNFPSKSAVYRYTRENFPSRILNTAVLTKPGRTSFEYKGWRVEFVSD